ncbi:hypothetical protein [Burkholderia stagnalis]
MTGDADAVVAPSSASCNCFEPSSSCCSAQCCHQCAGSLRLDRRRQFRIRQPPGFNGGGNVMQVFARAHAERMMQRANTWTMPLHHAATLSRKSRTVIARRPGFGGRRFVGLSRLSVTDASAAGCSNHVGNLARKRSFNVSSGILSWRSTDCSHTSAKRSRAAEADAFPE